jgi:oligoendopeptidase F
VELVVRTVAAHYPLMARYYRLKREILGCDRLMHYDRYAPLFSTKREIPFDRARDIVLASFSRFNPALGELAGRFFEHSWIDAAVRPGKQGGAFCSYVTPDLHPYVFVNYLNRMDDVMTLGHELGHAVHACLAREHGFLSFSPTLPVAELASTFGEILVFEALQRESEGEEKLALYAEKIEGAFATIFRQAAMYRFEQAIHARRREKGELTTEEFGAIWQSCHEETFGDSLELGDEHRFWWMSVSHFVNWPFYVYAYAFGELLVMSLYAMYMREGDSFAPKFIALLEVGGSKPPTEMLADVGMDIRDVRFWEGGLKVLEGFVERFEELYKQTGR